MDVQSGDRNMCKVRGKKYSVEDQIIHVVINANGLLNETDFKCWNTPKRMFRRRWKQSVSRHLR